MTSLESFLASYGLIAVLLGAFVEGETVLVLAGFAAHRGYLPFPMVVGAGLLGTLLGDQLYFYLGRRHGLAFLARRPGWRPRVARAQRFLDRHHIVFILGYRVLYGLRTISPFAVGLSDVRFMRFLALDAMSGLVWTVAVTSIGYSVGEGASALLGKAREFEIWFFLALTIAGLALWFGHFLQRRRRRIDDPIPNADGIDQSAVTPASPGCSD